MRHGDVDYFAADGRVYRPATVPLNADGRLQAEAAGRELATVPLDRVVTSGLRRSVETAELVLSGRALAVENRAELREIEPGKLLSSLTASPEEIAQGFLGALDVGVTRDTRFLGGETFGEVADRVWPCFESLLGDRDWRHLLIVAHGVVNRVLLARMLGSDMAGVSAFEQDAGCLNVIDVTEDGRFLVRLLNHSPLNALKVGVELTTMERLYEQYLRTRSS
jgi:probable phosphoglycerate mutase